MIHWLNPRCLRRASSACSKCMVLISVVNELLLNFICCNLQLAEGAFQFRCLPACPRQLCWLVSEWKGITWVLVEVTGDNRVRLWCFPILYIIFNHNEMIVYPLMHGLLEEKNKWQLRELLMFRKDPGFRAFSFLNNEILGGGEREEEGDMAVRVKFAHGWKEISWNLVPRSYWFLSSAHLSIPPVKKGKGWGRKS